MKITPVNYNYTNQKAQRNKNQTSFGMIPDAASLKAYIELLKPDCRISFENELKRHYPQMGEMACDGGTIIAKILFRELKRGRKIFTVDAQCGDRIKSSASFEVCPLNGGIAAKRLWSALRDACWQLIPRQEGHSKEAIRPTESIVERAIQACKAFDPTQC